MRIRAGFVVVTALAVLAATFLAGMVPLDAQPGEAEVIILALDSSATPDQTPGLLLVAPNGSGFRRIATSGPVRTFDVSPDGTQIVYVTGAEIWSVGIDGKNDTRWLRSPNVTYRTPVFSGDGESLYFVSIEHRAGVMNFNELEIASGRTNQVRMSSDPEARMYRMHRSPSGRYLLVTPTSLFIGEDDGGGMILYEPATDTAESLPLLTNNGVWLPGDVILWESLDDYETYDPRTEATVETAAYTDFRYEEFAANPDGSVVVELVERDGLASLVSVDLVTGVRTPFPDGIPDVLYGEGLLRWVRTTTPSNPALCEGWVITKTGGRKANKITGTDGADVIASGKGGDRVDGGAGNDVLCGGLGNDRLVGGKGDDIIFGGSGRDRLSGKGGADRLFGQNSKDKLFGGNGNDLLDGGKGTDQGDGGKGFDNCSDKAFSSCEG